MSMGGREPGKLFVGGLNFSTTESALGETFGQFGSISECKIITDRETGRSRGFGFITFDSPDAAAAARSAMHEQELDGRTIRVDYANKREYGGGFGGRR
ncbi:RNA-binding protein 3-like isoform X1 [Branchiostoma lanceolatum]|uniref:CIRBP protein n=2 Tax=Branchiostoma lanceolatum TaxID=7740 RepID=A0A8J9ZCS5_BRALA|nr:CIRBP [Branchiostoma lanceolatum]